MRILFQFISAISLILSSSCSNIEKENTVKLKTGLDSIFYQSIEDYQVYMNKEISKFGGDTNYLIIVLTSKSSDTLSLLINCGESDDLSRIISYNLSHVYKINKRFIFSESQLFTSYSQIDFKKIASRIDELAYKQYLLKGAIPAPKALWDCQSLYLVVKKNKILRNEIRYFSTEPKMWTDDFI